MKKLIFPLILILILIFSINCFATAWDVSMAVYTGKNKLIGAHDNTVYGITFSSDGTKMYFTGVDNAIILQYTLATPWDVSTATDAKKSCSVGAQDTGPRGIAFNLDGTKMYVAGNTNNTVYQYILSTAWDVSTADFDNKSFSVTDQDATPYDVTFNPDGAKMYITGYANDTIFQYTLSTPWDVSTAEYAEKSCSVGAQDSKPRGIAFNSDGDKMYYVGTDTDSVYQYTLTTAWDVSTATYAEKLKYVGDKDGNPYGVAFNSDGDKMYFIGWSSATIFQYTLSTPWDVSTAEYAEKLKSTKAQDTYPYDVTFKPDGTQMYITGGDTNTVYQYLLSIAWDVDTAVYADKSVYVGTQDGATRGLAFSSDGRLMYVVGNTSDTVYQYYLATVWDVGTAFYDDKLKSVGAQDLTPYGVAFNSNGNRMYIMGYQHKTAYQYTLPTPWDIVDATYLGKFKSVEAQDLSPYDITFSPNGSNMYITGLTNDTVFQYYLSTAWNIDTATYTDKSKNIHEQDSTPRGVAFNTDGTIMFIIGATRDTVYQFSLVPIGWPHKWNTKEISLWNESEIMKWNLLE